MDLVPDLVNTVILHTRIAGPNQYLGPLSAVEKAGVKIMMRLTDTLPKFAAGYCEEKKRLQDEFLQAAHSINELLSRQTRALIENDPEFARYDALLHHAQSRKEAAKFAWLSHIDAHGCREHFDGLDLNHRKS
jgi:hypothetical protein